MRFVLSFCLFVFSLMGKAEWGGNPVCWWLDLYFCFVCCLDEVSCRGCYGWFGDSGSCTQVVLFVWVLTIWYSLGLVLCYSMFLGSVVPLQRLRAWSLARNEDYTSSLLWHWVRLKQKPNFTILYWFCHISTYKKIIIIIKSPITINWRWTPDKWQLQNQANSN